MHPPFTRMEEGSKAREAEEEPGERSQKLRKGFQEQQGDHQRQVLQKVKHGFSNWRMSAGMVQKQGGEGRNLFCFELDFLSFGILKMTPLVAQW